MSAGPGGKGVDAFAVARVVVLAWLTCATCRPGKCVEMQSREPACVLRLRGAADGTSGNEWRATTATLPFAHEHDRLPTGSEVARHINAVSPDTGSLTPASGGPLPPPGLGAHEMTRMLAPHLSLAGHHTPLFVLIVWWDHYAMSHSLQICCCDKSATSNTFIKALGNILPEHPYALQQQAQAQSKLASRLLREIGPVRGSVFQQLLCAVEDPLVDSIDEQIAALHEMQSEALLKEVQCMTSMVSAFEAADKEASTAIRTRDQVRFWKEVDEGNEAEAVRLLASGRIEVDMKDSKHWAQLRALHRAARLGHSRLLIALVRRGANLRYD